MVAIKSGPIELVRGIVEDALGRAKQVIGIIIGHNDLIKEGRLSRTRRKHSAMPAGRKPKPRRLAPRPKCTSRVNGPSRSKWSADRAGPVHSRARFAF
jgi:hypothetical protein